MKPFRFVVFISGCLLTTGIAATGMIAPHVVENLTPSLPRGYYWASPLPAHLKRGEITLVCPPPDALHVIEHAGQTFLPGDCPGHYLPFMKIVVGLPGDRVRVTDQGIRINEKLLLHSRPLRRSFLPRPQPTTVGPHEAWVWSPVPGSVDSRYLGTVRPLAVVAPMGSIRAEDQKLMVPTLRNE